MKIAICGSMIFGDKMLDKKEELEKMGHDVFVSDYASQFGGVSEEKKLELNTKHVKEDNALRNHCRKIEKSGAILVLNYDRKGIKNYIGGNTFLEIGYAYILHKNIYLLNPVPEIEYYSLEIENMEPVIINGDLSLIK